MVKLLFILFFTVSAICTQSQNVGIGTTNPNAYAALEISSSNKGLLIPRTSTSSRTAIAAPPKGLLVYDSSFSAFYYYDGGRWLPVSEKNYDSSTVDYSSSAIIGTNLPTSTGASISISSNDNSGFIYDNGGPSGNYLLNSNSSVTISQDDATLAIKITIEELNAETFYDSLFIIYGSSIFNGNTLDTVGISGTQLGSYTFNTNVKILFKSNAVNQLAGFKIRWSRIKMNTTATEPTPVYGWYFNTAKQAMLGGTSKNNNWQLDSIGINSFNYGIGAKAKGESAIAIGRFSSAINTNSISIGEISKAYGDGAISIGKFTEANSSYTTAIGYGNSANGYSATSIGHLANALGDLSVAIGSEYYIGTSYPTQAIADYATALGSAASARGIASTALGYFSNAIGTSSTAFTDAYSYGYSSVALKGKTLGDFSTSTGRSNYATGYSTLVAGMYNDSIITRQTAVTSSTPLLIIGNGNSEIDRTNALVVLKNGNVAIGDNGNPVNKLHITGTINNVSLSDNSGMMTIGYTSSTNMVIDQNDLQVRNSGAISDLYLQRLGGNVGIGNTGVPAYQLELSTNSAGKPGTNTWTIASDLRLKQNINPYTQGLQQLMQINPVTYHYNEKSGFDTKPEYVGIIAQDLQKIAPYMVSTVKRNDADYLGVDNGAMTYMLINAVKEQQEIIEALKKRIEVLERK